LSHIPDDFCGLAVAVTVVALPPDSPPSVFPLKRLDNFLELLCSFPVFSIVTIRIRGVSDLFGGGRGTDGLGLGVLGGCGNRGSL